MATRPTFRPAELIRATAIARRYYLEGESKVRIADDFGISRFKVARILDEARDAGIVRIEISAPTEIDASLSHDLRTAYRLHEAVVVDQAGDDETVRRSMGRIAAEYLTEILEEGDTLGLACSRTLNEMTLALGELPRCTVVQLTGVLPGGVEENSVELVRRVASLARGPAFPIYAPLVVSDAATTRALRAQPQVADAMQRYGHLSKAVVAIGAWTPTRSLVRDALPLEEGARLEEQGVRAEVCARTVDAQGAPTAPGLSERVVAITLEQLRAVPEVVAVAGGAGKAEAIRAVLRTGVVGSLVTDVATARLLLEPGGA
ncbi:sugar-binding transcriptional regulator [Nocardiopsis aegyptia]|uniref:DNA-binding transcriptional regulator LsrR (DeoR family) n=1 Tax=Nocardiopsis aegyptia TaxID=220378 RepID=A0A7Z0EJA9_9ACTN|nr:sugar-binding domain-containing protein [Nocardiopsis aegyptia]NYJ33119.1 DNA-binding transcriptional regulator LsrR (DeoR family) [Nocardiopsis aegyptia]